MGTSNWQNISFNINLICIVKPQRVLDVGVGMGRWGIVCREFLDVWDGRVFPEEWTTTIEGVEIFAEQIQPYHASFYNIIHNEDAFEFLQRTTERYDLIIIGDVLEHFEKERGKAFLAQCIERSTFVMLNIPLGRNWPQEGRYGNAHEEHKSVWNLKDFKVYPVVKKKKFRDYIYRPFAVLLFSSETSHLLTKKLVKERIRSLLGVYPRIHAVLKKLLR